MPRYVFHSVKSGVQLLQFCGPDNKHPAPYLRCVGANLQVTEIALSTTVLAELAEGIAIIKKTLKEEDITLQDRPKRQETKES